MPGRPSAIVPREDPIVALQARVQLLEVRLAALEGRGRAPRDAADEALLDALRELVSGGTFVTADVLERAHLDPAWRRRLDEADIESAADLGYVLRRCTGVRGLTRIGKVGQGAVWQFSGSDDPSSIVRR